MLYFESISDPSSDMDKKYDQLQIYRKKKEKQKQLLAMKQYKGVEQWYNRHKHSKEPKI